MTEIVPGSGGSKPADGPKKMTDEDLLELISQYSRASIGAEVASGATVGNAYVNSEQEMTTAQVDRFNAINAYFARPIGNEEENASQVVIPEFRDTVEWVMPQLMRIYMAAQSPCVFDPEGPDDTRQAAIETAATNHVFMRLNEGFFVVHDYMKDSMILRNGYIRVEVVDEEKTSEESYSGLNELGLTQLLQKKDDKRQVEVIEQDEYQMEVPPPLDAPPGTPGQPQTVFDVKLRITEKVKRIVVEALPPEEMRIAAGTRSNDLDKSKFVEHKTKKTRSELISDGFDADVINGLAAVPDDWLEMVALARNEVIDELQTEDIGDFSMQEIPVSNITIMVDYDGDGIAERRQVLVAGNKIIDNEVIEECPVASGVPKRMPHRHTGISLYDELVDLQVLKSELARQGIDGLRLSTRGRVGVDWKNCNLDDLMEWRMNGLVRTNGNPQAVLFPFQAPSNIMGQVIPMMEQVDKWRTMRTGVGEGTMGLDADELNDVTKGAKLAAMSAASLKIEMVARLLAEGLKGAYLKVHAALIRHQDVPMRFQMGEEWVETNPSKWKKRTRISPNVGLGSGNREESRANFAMLGAMMEKAHAAGLVSPKQVYNAFKMGVSLLGYEHPEAYAMDPSGPEFKEWQKQQQQSQPPDPRVQAAKINAGIKHEQIQADLKEAGMEQQTEKMRAQAELAHDALQGREDRQVDMAQTDAQMFTDLAKILATIVGRQLQGDPSANAGAVLRQDVQSLEGR